MGLRFVTLTPEMSTTEILKEILVLCKLLIEEHWAPSPVLHFPFHGKSAFSYGKSAFYYGKPAFSHGKSAFSHRKPAFFMKNLFFLTENLLFLPCWCVWEPCIPLEGSLTLLTLPCWIFPVWNLYFRAPQKAPSYLELIIPFLMRVNSPGVFKSHFFLLLLCRWQ